jgi:hypothetical protein
MFMSARHLAQLFLQAGAWAHPELIQPMIDLLNDEIVSKVNNKQKGHNSK